MKKILHIPNYYYPHIGGIEQVAHALVTSLKEIEVEQKILCFNSEKKTTVDTVENISVTRVGTFIKVSSQSLTFKFKKELNKMMREFKPDIIVFHYPNPLVAHYLLKAIKKTNCKLILYWHLDITKQKIIGQFFKGQSKRLIKRAEQIVATSPNYVKGSKFLSTVQDKCIVIPNCINEGRITYDNNIVEKAKQIKNDKTILFAFGRHVKYKGLTYLIQASKLLNDDYEIFIGGEGELTKKLKKQAKKDAKITFLGRLSDDDLKAYMLACDIFCFPSITKNEAFGLGLAEAMFYGKPVITFTIPGSGVNYVSLNNTTGLEVDNRNVKEYANAIQKMASDSDLREKFGRAAKTRCEELFSYSKYRENVKDLIIKILKGL